MGIVSEADTSGLAVYCEAVSRWRRLATEAADAPTYLPGERGAIKVNPIFRAEQNAATVVRILAREFGLTPSARAGIRVEHVIRGDAGRLLTSDG
jgi:P27 family predicted phage terminase small subunit